jgi:hypothetical protein
MKARNLKKVWFSIRGKSALVKEIPYGPGNRFSSDDCAIKGVRGERMKVCST